MDLTDLIQEEIQERFKKKQQREKDVYKTCSTIELNSYFERGWEFVSQYRADDTTACRKTGKYIVACIRDNKCSACGDRVDWMQVISLNFYLLLHYSLVHVSLWNY